MNGYGNEVYTISEVPGSRMKGIFGLGKGLSILREKGVDIDKIIVMPPHPDTRPILDVAVLGKPRTQL